MTVKFGVIGAGKIARQQHIPAIAAQPGCALSAIADPVAKIDGIPVYPTAQEMLDNHPEIDAVAVCTPPQARHRAARAALRAGKHVLLEKPPAATLQELGDLERWAAEANRTLFTAWHVRYAPAVTVARRWLRDKVATGIAIDWKEDVRHWHPGQTWIQQAGGFGVFDAGMNALSVLTEILPERVFLWAGDLFFPSNWDAPVAADLDFETETGAPLKVTFDWRHQGPEVLDIRIKTRDGGRLVLSQGATRISFDGQAEIVMENKEYEGVYLHFFELIGQGRSFVDAEPFRHVADAYLRARRVTVEPFEF